MGAGARLMGTGAVMMVVIVKKKARGPKRVWLWLFCRSGGCRGREVVVAVQVIYCKY